jgi:hypothetical protein
MWHIFSKYSRALIWLETRGVVENHQNWITSHYHMELCLSLDHSVSKVSNDAASAGVHNQGSRLTFSCNTNWLRGGLFNFVGIGVWNGVAMDFIKFHLGPPCPTLLCPAGVARLQGRLILLWTPHDQGHTQVSRAPWQSTIARDSTVCDSAARNTLLYYYTLKLNVICN